MRVECGGLRKNRVEGKGEYQISFKLQIRERGGSGDEEWFIPLSAQSLALSPPRAMDPSGTDVVEHRTPNAEQRAREGRTVAG